MTPPAAPPAMRQSQRDARSTTQVRLRPDSTGWARAITSLVEQQRKISKRGFYLFAGAHLGVPNSEGATDATHFQGYRYV
jgi:hypothetical protein